MDRLSGLLQSLERREGPFLFDGSREWSYTDLAGFIRHWRAWYRSRAWGKVVGLRADYGAQSIGLLLALVSERQTVALAPRDAKSDEYLAEASCEQVISIGSHGEASVDPLAARPASPLLETLSNRGEAGLVIFTSGSSGRPKAALHSIERLLSKYEGTHRPTRTLAFLMFDHIAGLDTLFYSLTAGGALVTVTRRDPTSVMRALREGRVQVLPASPTFLRLFLASGARAEDFPELGVITYGSEAMDPATLRLLVERFPSVRIIQKYGTTETGSPRTESRSPDSLWLRFRDGSAGQKAEMQVRDGVLWLRTSGTLLGYLNAAAPIDEAGWYCTGDLVEQEGEWIRVLGRASELINVGGEKVSPGEVESTILELPFVATAVVSGEPHAMLGQIVVARLTVHQSESRSPAEIGAQVRRHCRGTLAGYKVPVKVHVLQGAGATERLKTDRASAAMRPR